MSHSDCDIARRTSKRSWSGKEIIRAAWLEFIVARMWSRSDGHHYLELVAEVQPWFTAVELGLAPGQGPTIFWTLDHLAEINKAHRAELTGRRLKNPKRSPETISEARRREWRALARSKAMEKADARRRRKERRASEARAFAS